MFERLKEIMLQYIDIEESEITEDSRFVEDLGFDSFSVMTFAGDIEDEYDIEIDERAIAEVRTVGDMIKYIEKLQKESK